MSYYLAEIKLDSDGSGGTITCNMTTDPQFQSIISLINVQMVSGAADRVVAVGLFTEQSDIILNISGTMVFNADVGQILLYSPPPLFPCRRIRAVVDNVDTETFELAALIYNFKRDAFQRTPLNVLTASLPRGFDIQ